jgi:hypothetical protein
MPQSLRLEGIYQWCSLNQIRNHCLASLAAQDRCGDLTDRSQRNLRYHIDLLRPCRSLMNELLRMFVQVVFGLLDKFGLAGIFRYSGFWVHPAERRQ